MSHVIAVVRRAVTQPKRSGQLPVAARRRRRDVFESLRLQAKKDSCKVTTFPLWLSTYTLYIFYIIHSVHSKHCEAGTLETTIINSAVGAAGSHSVHSKQCEAATLETTIINSAVETLWSCNINRRVAALQARTAAIYRTTEVPHTLPIFSRSRVIVDHHMSICQTGRPVACTQCASRNEAHCSASLRAWRFSAGLLSWGPVS